MSNVVENVSSACEALGEFELLGTSLEEADPRSLDVRSSNIDEHVALQPAAIAYYGSLKKEAARRMAILKRNHERWRKKKWYEAKLKAGNKPTIADVDAMFIIANEDELAKQDKQVDKLHEELDMLDVWYAAWLQKSHSIREHAALAKNDMISSPHIMEKGTEKKSEKNNPNSKKISNIKSIIRQNS